MADKLFTKYGEVMSQICSCMLQCIFRVLYASIAFGFIKWSILSMQLSFIFISAVYE